MVFDGAATGEVEIDSPASVRSFTVHPVSDTVTQSAVFNGNAVCIYKNRARPCPLHVNYRIKRVLADERYGFGDRHMLEIDSTTYENDVSTAGPLNGPLNSVKVSWTIVIHNPSSTSTDSLRGLSVNYQQEKEEKSYENSLSTHVSTSPDTSFGPHIVRNKATKLANPTHPQEVISLITYSTFW